jgi:excisionase family DNA binding protein
MSEAKIEYTPTPLAYDVPEVARILKCHTDTVYDLIRSGRLRGKPLGKQRAIRVSAKALADFMDSDD